MAKAKASRRAKPKAKAKPRANAKAKAMTSNGWKTCSRGHKFRGAKVCPVCWPSGARRAKKPR